MYHRIGRCAADPWDLCVWPEHFESHIERLREHTEIVPLHELRGRLRPGRRSTAAVAITFDDGYADNLYAAKPVLDRYEAPATVFLATGYVGSTRPYWWDELASLIVEAPGLPPRLAVESSEGDFTYDDCRMTAPGLAGRRARRQLHDRLWRWLSRMNECGRNGALETIRQWSGQPLNYESTSLPMTKEEIARLVADGLVEIGCHTVSHCKLSSQPYERKSHEISTSRLDCTHVTGRIPVSFAFPHGDFDGESVDLVREAGFEVACTSQPGLVWSTTNPLTMPRIAVGNWDGDTFLRKLRWWLA
jgi:peptidoglycan/xylan/chitin deacetylase (PgdA/CDA1 family)